MSQYHPDVTKYIDKSAEFAQPILQYLRERVHEYAPMIEESIKWGSISFGYKGIVCGMAAFKQHCVFGFWKNKAMMAQFPELTANGDEAMYQFGKLTSIKQLPKKAQFKKMMQYAIMLNEQSLGKTTKKPSDKSRTIEAPADLTKALKANKAAWQTFEAFAYSHKKEYVEWIEDAKRAETRERRIAQAVTMIADGLDRHHKYKKKK
ncbi:MAG: hypothetical protein RL660_3032 [Bacteroidota bacterium]|jgi:uncharacterized protein YdeI (YjbR/CyaY-like superfamily)